MDPSLVVLLIVLAAGFLWTLFKNYGSKSEVPQEVRILNLMNYAAVAVKAAEQEYSLTDLPAAQLRIARKRRANDLMIAFAKEAGYTITPELAEAISGMIEAAVQEFNERHYS